MKKILLAIFLAVITCMILVGAFIIIFPQTLAVLTVKLKLPQSKYPEIYIRPQTRTVNGTSDLIKKQTDTFQNKTIAFPWSEAPNKIEKTTIVSWTFKKANKTVIATDMSVVDDFVSLNWGVKNDVTKLREFYGGSGYELYKQTMELTPNQINIFTPKKEALAKSVLLILKATIIPAFKEKEIYEFEVNGIKGFQFGNPKQGNGVDVQFFDTNEKAREIVFRGATQEEIDFILFNLKVNL